MMAVSVQIKDVVEALEIQFEESASYLDLDSGEVHTVSREILRDVEASDEGEEPDIPDWQADEWELAKRILFSGRFKRLPDKFDIHEWQIMSEFTETVKANQIREELRDAIRGKGAFRYFKDALRRHGIEQEWFAFRAEALRQIAIEWCEGIGVAWK